MYGGLSKSPPNSMSWLLMSCSISKKWKRKYNEEDKIKIMLVPIHTRNKKIGIETRIQ